MKNKIIGFFINIASSGKYSEKKDFGMSDYLIRYVLLNFTIFFGIIILSAYNILNFQKGLYAIVAASTGMIVILLVCFILARTKIPQSVPSSVLMFFYGFLCVWLTSIQQVLGLNFLFIYVYPLLSIMLLGLVYGSILSTILLLFVSSEMFVPGLAKYNYHVEGAIRMLATYLLVLLVMIVIEFTRKTKDKLIESQRRELQEFNNNLQKMVEEETQDIADLQNALLKTMAELVEYRDNTTGSHIERTQKGLEILLDEIAKEDIYAEEINKLNIALLIQSSQLHDIGKISISDNVLKKPAKLTDEEFAEMKGHVTFGEEIIAKIESLTKKSDFLKYAEIFCASHHEKWNGTGYPRGLKEKNIPLLGRLMAIVDVYDALTSVRPYKKAFTHEEAAQILTENKGTQFEPVLVDMFIRAMESRKL